MLDLVLGLYANEFHLQYIGNLEESSISFQRVLRTFLFRTKSVYLQVITIATRAKCCSSVLLLCTYKSARTLLAWVLSMMIDGILNPFQCA